MAPILMEKLMHKADDRGRLIYGSVKGIKKAFKAGAGSLTRKDVKILLKRIEELESKDDN